MAQPPQRGWRRLAYTERTMNYPRIRQKIPVAVYNNLTAMSDAEAPDMGGKLQVYRLEKRKGEVDDANIIARIGAVWLKIHQDAEEMTNFEENFAF